MKNSTLKTAINELMLINRYDYAIEILENKLKSDSRNGDLWLDLAQLLEAQGFAELYGYHKDAIKCYKKSVRLNPRSAYAHWSYADFCNTDDKQRWKIAKRHYGLCLKLIETKTNTDKMPRTELAELKNDAVEGYDELMKKINNEKYLKKKLLTTSKHRKSRVS